MGLIKSAIKSIGGTFHEQWEDYIKCDELSNDVLMVKVAPETGQISKKSRIQVGPGQLAVIFDSGRIVDATAEEGIYEFDQSTSPSFFAGQFGAVFKEMWQRFTYNGTPAKEQAVFYINMKEIIDNKFGTLSPVPYQDWGHLIPNQMTGGMTPLRVDAKCFGKYTFQIKDPVIFMENVMGTASIYRRESITEQMTSEVVASFQMVLNELGTEKYKVPALNLPSQAPVIKEIMGEKEFDQDIQRRGIKLLSFVVESVTLSEESNRKIDSYELSSNAALQKGTLAGAYATAVQDAANNDSGTAAGFMGIGMMNMASGGVIGGAATSAFQENTTPATGNTTSAAVNPETSAKFCSNCGSPAKGNFCSNCGQKIG